jgi:hypothetical protein
MDPDTACASSLSEEVGRRYAASDRVGGCKSLEFGAEIYVLEEGWGVDGVDGLAEVAGDNMGSGELLSARTTFAEAPQRFQNFKDALQPWNTMLGWICWSNICGLE